MLVKEIIVFYLVIINLFSFLLFWRDKRLATQRSIRIPESVLLTSALVGGSIGAIVSMYLFRHKTRKPKFVIGIPIIIIIQIIFLFVVSYSHI